MPKKSTGGRRGSKKSSAKKRGKAKKTVKRGSNVQGRSGRRGSSKGVKTSSGSTGGTPFAVVHARAKNAYQVFATEASRGGNKSLPAGGAAPVFDFTELAARWKALNPNDRKPFELCAELDKERSALGKLQNETKCENDAPVIAKHAKRVVDLMHIAPQFARRCGIIEASVSALEDLDRRLSRAVRAAMAPHMGLEALTTSKANLDRNDTFGRTIGGRVTQVLLRWRQAPTTAVEPRAAPVATPSPPPRLAERPAPAADRGAVDQGTRKKVVQMLMKTFAKAIGKAEVLRSREIERELFALAGSEAKKYRLKARAITFNLRSEDGTLLRRLLDGNITLPEFVRLDAEELAPESIKAERREQREKYFREQVLDLHGPPKRKRDLLVGGPPLQRRKSAEGGGKESSGEEQQEPAVGSNRAPQGLARRGSAEDSGESSPSDSYTATEDEGLKEASAASDNPPRAELEEGSTDNSKGSSESSSDSSDESDSSSLDSAVLKDVDTSGPMLPLKLD